MFADHLYRSIQSSRSVVVAGFDPELSSFPEFILREASAKTSNNEEAIYKAITSFYAIALQAFGTAVAAIKPNIAFFEQYGLGGIRAFVAVCSMVKAAGLPLIVDCKRGDIGTTAKAYSRAFLGRANYFGTQTPVFDADAITVSPFLGFDTVEAFLDDCKEFGKGIFVLVKTSNPGSTALQNCIAPDTGASISETVAHWLAKNADTLIGTSGYSGLGAVVGATYPAEARKLRALMPNNFFLIPGVGPQGGTPKDALAAFDSKKGGGIINLSRLLFGELSKFTELGSLKGELSKRLITFNATLAKELHIGHP